MINPNELAKAIIHEMKEGGHTLWIDPETKECTKCNEIKPLADFSSDASRHDGLTYWCTKCRKQHREENKAKIRARDAAASAAYRAAYPEKVAAAKAAYYAANTQKILTNKAAYYRANQERIAAYRAANLDKHRIHSHNRRAIISASGVRLSKDLAIRLLKLQRGKCACGCKQPLGSNYHLDHIMPLALGGANTDDNIQLLCAGCNQQKHAKHPIDFMQQRGFLL